MVLAVIPARGGSKGIPRKNVRLMHGKPLIYYSIQNALACSYIDDVVVSSDDEEILSIAAMYGAKAMNRNSALAQDAVTLDPVLISVGASNEDEITRTLSLVRSVNDQPIALLHCVLEYPTPYEHANLNKITSLKKSYAEDPIYADKNGSPILIGYSDHTKPDTCADVIKTAYNLGAVIVEKHFTLDKTLKGNDHYHAMDPDDAKNILKGIAFIDTLRGSYDLKCLDSEASARSNARRSIVTTCDIKKGAILTPEMLTYKRPGTGIPPEKMNEIIGRTMAVDVKEDTILQEGMLS